MDRASLDEFLLAPVGRWAVVSGTTLVFLAAPHLGGCVAWGRPSREDAERAIRAYGVLHNPALAPSFDVLFDGHGITEVDPAALEVLVGWVDARKGELAARVRLQVGVVADTLVGYALSGILPVLGDTHRFRIVRDRREALRALGADALSAELDACVASARGQPAGLSDLRELLRARRGAVALAGAARALAVSTRTLQRVLMEGGTTFRRELRDARFEAARELLTLGDEKVSAIAARVGLSETALAELVRERAGVTPAALRRRSTTAPTAASPTPRAPASAPSPTAPPPRRRSCASSPRARSRTGRSP